MVPGSGASPPSPPEAVDRVAPLRDLAPDPLMLELGLGGAAHAGPGNPGRLGELVPVGGAAVAAPHSPHRSPRILQLYDGRRSPSPGRRRKVPKVAAAADLLKLPLSDTPTPLTRGKLKQLARCCDLNADAILAHALAQASSSGGVARPPQAGGSSTSSDSDCAILDV
ncbi:uncharacterized protein [Triticum aestivum]|uniref:uncharacterized protein isoform X2 n=1 Tax=Triticum aestivum TaxID=4565 RepID=UPI001D02788C|nr:uncharacterized protein LOC123098651 isoform X2 [Triticum aestivum]